MLTYNIHNLLIDTIYDQIPIDRIDRIEITTYTIVSIIAAV